MSKELDGSEVRCGIHRPPNFSRITMVVNELGASAFYLTLLSIRELFFVSVESAECFTWMSDSHLRSLMGEFMPGYHEGG